MTEPDRWYFNEKRAQRACKFFERLLYHSKGEFQRQPFILEDWQRTIIRDVFGWLEVGTDLRRYRTVYIEVPKKNGKSPLAAGIALYLLGFDDEPGAEVYLAAGDQKQANIVYSYAADFVEETDALPADHDAYQALSNMYTVRRSTHRILYPASKSLMVAVSSDVPTKHGPNISALIFDELHSQPNRELWDTLRTGVAARRQPLTVAITTAGIYDESSICWEQHEYTRRVNAGEIEDDRFYGVIFTLDPDDDYRDEAVWKKANPSLGRIRKVDQLSEEVARAASSPAYQNTVKRLYFNIWTQQRERFLDMGIWKRTAGTVYPEDLQGEMAFSAFDLSIRTDLTALVHVFPDEDGFFDVIARHWMPEEDLHGRSVREGVNYELWAEQGWIQLCPGSVVDLEWVFEQFRQDYAEYDIQEVAFDPYRAEYLTTKLDEEFALDLIPFQQGIAHMSEPTKALLEMATQMRLVHGNNPVLNWEAECLEVKQDPVGNVRPMKPKRQASSKRIDGMVALIMALWRAMLSKGESVYAERGILTLGG